MVEDLVYADTLAQAVASEGTLEELAYVAAFACSVYAQTSSNARISKPFNPLLGETFECDRRAESGWRCILEQVSMQCRSVRYRLPLQRNAGKMFVSLCR